MSMQYRQTAWSLDDLFTSSDSSEIKATFASLDQLITEFEKQRDLLDADMSVERLLEMIRQYEVINAQANRIYSYAGLRFAADTQDQQAATFLAQVEQQMAALQNRGLFFSLWWKGLDGQAAERLMAGAGEFRYWLEEMRHFKPHTLTEAEEKIVNIKNVTGANALGNLYDSITNRYVFKVEVDGEVKELTRGELMVYVRQHDSELRARAYQELYRVYGEDGPILGQIYQTIVRDWRSEQVDLRKFNSPMAARNLINDIPDQVVDTLLEVARQNAHVFQRFFRLKASRLGVDRLRRYDVYAPVAKSNKMYAFNDAADMVLDAFNQFDPQISRFAQRVFDDNHLDSEVRKGKRGGAFCASVTPDLTPWVLLNYQSRPDDVATMAHELGHAIHSMLASQHSVLTFQSNLPLAETASTFGEMLLIDKLLATETDEGVRRDMLFRQVDDAYATIMRQSFFALFEKEAHQMVQDGASVDDLAEAYLKNLQTQFGDAVEVSDEFRWEWVSIPHIYQVPFYVYAYAFGQLLVFALYQQFKEEGEAFKPRYTRILSAGGSKAPVQVLSEAGIDIHKAEFWQGGFDVIRRLVDQLEQLQVG
jgi:oligoendopeptidase F